MIFGAELAGVAAEGGLEPSELVDASEGTPDGGPMPTAGTSGPSAGSGESGGQRPG